MLTKNRLVSFLLRNIIFIEAISHISVFLQAWRILDKKDGSQISLVSFVIRLLMSILWLSYAIIRNNNVAKTGETLELIGIILVISLVVYFRDPLNKRLDYPDEHLLKEDPNAVIKKFSPETYKGNNTAYFLINRPVRGELVPSVVL